MKPNIKKLVLLNLPYLIFTPAGMGKAAETQCQAGSHTTGLILY